MTDLKARFDRFADNLRRRETRDLLEDAVSAAESIARAVKEPGPASIIAEGMTVAKALTGSGLHYYDAFLGDLWTKLPVDETFVVQVAGLLDPHITSTENLGGCAHCKAFYVEHNGALIAWARDLSQGRSGYSELYCSTSRLDPSLVYLRDRMWEGIHPTRIVLASKGEGKMPELSPDDVVGAKKSKVADEYVPYLKTCMDQGVTRNVLFYGVPGTGKSTVSRTICASLGLRSLRIRAENAGHMSNSMFEELVETFMPGVVILDDLDRAHNQVALLECLEAFKKNVRFVFATVNDLDALDPALKRPGRFDEVIRIDDLDEEAVKALLGEYTDALDTVRTWPVAYIQEYCIRRRLLGREKAELALAELKERIDALQS